MKQQKTCRKTFMLQDWNEQTKKRTHLESVKRKQTNNITTQKRNMQ